MKQFLDDCLPNVKEKIGRQVGLDICVCVNTSALLVQTIGWWGWGWPQTTGYSHTQGFGEERGRWEGVESRDVVQSWMPASFRPASFLIVLRLWSWLSSQTVVLSFGCVLRPTAGKFFKNSDAPGWLNPDLWERDTYIHTHREMSFWSCLWKVSGSVEQSDPLWKSHIRLPAWQRVFCTSLEAVTLSSSSVSLEHFYVRWNFAGPAFPCSPISINNNKKTQKSFIHTQCASLQVIHVKCKVQYFLGISTALCIHPSPPSILEHFN